MFLVCSRNIRFYSWSYKYDVGYTGGDTINPTYEEVCSGTTNHAEAIEIEYDPKVISYEELLKQFWIMHDPTTLNRQGPDIGTQYRSAIFYLDAEQKKIAEQSKIKMNNEKFNGTIVTEITKSSIFYPAEKYHQKYNEKMKKQYGIG
jgi:methionine-S-sulfoxide reductase